MSSLRTSYLVRKWRGWALHECIIASSALGPSGSRHSTLATRWHVTVALSSVAPGVAVRYLCCLAILVVILVYSMLQRFPVKLHSKSLHSSCLFTQSPEFHFQMSKVEVLTIRRKLSEQKRPLLRASRSLAEPHFTIPARELIRRLLGLHRARKSRHYADSMQCCTSISAREPEMKDASTFTPSLLAVDPGQYFNFRVNSALPAGTCVYVQSADPGDFDGEYQTSKFMTFSLR